MSDDKYLSEDEALSVLHNVEEYSGLEVLEAIVSISYKDSDFLALESAWEAWRAVEKRLEERSSALEQGRYLADDD
jgi:hypothetical protein